MTFRIFTTQFNGLATSFCTNSTHPTFASHLNEILSRKELIDVLGADADLPLVRHAIFFKANK